MLRYITKGKTAIEKRLLRRYSFIQKINRDGILIGYRLYGRGCFGLPSWRSYYWI